jgi:hypothetical protein
MMLINNVAEEAVSYLIADFLKQHKEGKLIVPSGRLLWWH